MGYKSTSTRRTSAASAVSSQSVVVNTPSGFSAVGASIKSNTSISLGVTTAGQTSAATTTTVSAGPVIANIAYLDANNSVTSANAVSTSGGNIRITGTGFVANSAVYINNTLATNTFVSSTQITAVCPAASAGNVAIMIFTPTDVGIQKFNAVRYSGVPTWTTAAISLQNNSTANVSLVASSDSTLTYTLQAGSTLPTGVTLNSAGYLVGTPTGYSGSTSISVVIIATDIEGQAAQQTINISVVTGDDQFKYTTLLLNGETSVTPFHKDSSANNFGLTLAGDVRADRFSPYYGNGYYSNSFSATPDYYVLPVSANLAFAGDYTLECWVYLNSVTGVQGVYSSIDNASDTWAGIYIGFSGTSFLATSYISSADTITHQTAVAVGQWYHLAMVRSGSTTKSYLNGVQSSGTTTSSYSLTQSGSSIGTAYPGSGPLNGYISNLRIVKGTALYTANFTPPTAPLTAISGTQLLTCQSSRAVDVSSNAFTLTATGTPRVSPAIPFASSSSYATYGSMYVPTAVTNYLSLPHTATTTITSGSTDSFSAECWVYFNSATASTSIMDQSGANTVTFQNWSFGLDGSKQFQIIWGGTGSPGSQIGYISGTTVARSGVWYHLAYVKTGAVWSLFVNGVRETTYSGLNTASDGTQNPLRIGSDTFSSQSINGYIADVRVYKGATAGAPYDASSSTITIPSAPLTAVPNTQLLTCQYNGGATNSWVTDSGQFNPVITKTGSIAQGTFSPYSQTGWSNYFPATGSYVSGSNSIFNISATTAVWTFETWVYPVANSNIFAIGSGGSYGNSFWIEWGVSTANKFKVGQGNGGGANPVSITTTGTYSANNWYHIAVSRTSAGVITLFVNGTADGTQTYNAASVATGTTFVINGLYDNNGLGNAGGTFYASNLRFIVGTALYTSNFTVPISPLTTITNTQLLTCQSNKFIDNSSNVYALTVTGTPSVRAISPFSPSAVYTPSLHGGSTYMSNATANYLTVTDSNIWNTGATTPAFTVEAWIYPIGITGGCVVSGMYANSKVPFVIGIGNAVGVTATNNQIWFGYYSGGWTGVISTAQLTMNAWTHVAGVYTGTDRYLYVNGVKVATATATWPAFSGTTTAGYIGKRWDGTGGGADGFNGYISDVRITKGTALYTAATITPPTAPLTASPNTALLLNMTNGGIVDAHSSNNVETVGNAQVSTAVKKYGNASMYFGGSQSLLFPGSSIPGGAGSAFTVEFWINAPSVNSLTIMRANGNASSLSLSTSASGQLIVSNVFAADFYTSTSTLSPNVWTHVAIVRNSSNLYTIYFNGVSAGTAVTYATSIGTATQMYMAYNTYTGGYSTFYLDDFRVTNGFARYTANFTAPTTALLGQ